MASYPNGKAKQEGALAPIHVWDLPTRLFHWLLAALVVVSFVTADMGGNAMTWHMRAGYAILALLLFRSAWGFFGGETARFSSFVRGPSAVFRYAKNLLKKDTVSHLGHNPLGGWSILAMMAALLLQAATGLFANDDIFIEGPLYPWVSKATSDLLTRIHRINPWVIIVLVSVHVAAVFFYLIYRKENLIGPMITGRKRWAPGHAEPPAGRLTTAAAIAVIVTAAVYLLVR